MASKALRAVIGRRRNLTRALHYIRSLDYSNDGREVFRRIRRIIELTPALITHYEAKRIYNALTRSRVGLMFIYMLVDIWKREDEARWKAPAPSLRSGDLIYDIENHEVRIRADAAQRLERSIERTNPAWLSAYLSTQPRDGIVRSGRSQWWIQRIHENKV